MYGCTHIWLQKKELKRELMFVSREWPQFVLCPENHYEAEVCVLFEYLRQQCETQARWSSASVELCVAAPGLLCGRLETDLSVYSF